MPSNCVVDAAAMPQRKSLNVQGLRAAGKNKARRHSPSRSSSSSVFGAPENAYLWICGKPNATKIGKSKNDWLWCRIFSSIFFLEACARTHTHTHRGFDLFHVIVQKHGRRCSHARAHLFVGACKYEAIIVFAFLSVRYLQKRLSAPFLDFRRHSQTARMLVTRAATLWDTPPHCILWDKQFQMFCCVPSMAGRNTEWMTAGFLNPHDGAESRVVRKYTSCHR